MERLTEIKYPTSLIPITKNDFEDWVGGEVTALDWIIVIGEVNGRLENFLDGILSDLIQDYKQEVGIFKKD